IRVVVETRADGASAKLRALVEDRDLDVDAIAGLAVLGEADTPAFLLKHVARFRPTGRGATIAALSTRPTWAGARLDAVAARTIARDEVPVFQVRQISSFPDDDLKRRIGELWPELKPIAASKHEQIEKLKTALATDELAKADLSNGRKRFTQAC